jgi:hypothetical protein
MERTVNNKTIKVLNTLPDLKLDSGTGNSIVLIASSKRGKSTIMKKIYDTHYAKNEKLITILISPTCHNQIFSTFPKKVIRINKFNKQVSKLIGDLALIQNKSENAYEFLFLIDDCINMRGKIIENMLCVLRNFNFSSCTCIQHYAFLSPASRGSINNLCVAGANQDSNIETLIKHCLQSEMQNMFEDDNQKKIPMRKLINIYREITDANDGHTFIRYIPQERDMQFFSLTK